MIEMKEKSRRFYRAVLRELTEHRSSFLVYIGLRLLVLLVLIRQLIDGHYENVFLCLLTLVLMILPSVVQAAFRVSFPSTLEIILLIFVFAAEILGEISAFFIQFPHWDTVLHTVNGFLCAAIGFSLVGLLNRESRFQFDLSPLFVALVAFCFSMTIGVLWEFIEYAADRLLLMDMQKDTVVTSIYSVMLDPTGQNISVGLTDIREVLVNGQDLGLGGYLDIGLIDTMEDLFVNFIGAAVFSVAGYFCIRHPERKRMIEGFIPTPAGETGTPENGPVTDEQSEPHGF